MRKALLGSMVLGVLLALPAGVPAAPAGGAEWAGWRGPGRDGISPDKGLLKAWPAGGPQKLWTATGIGKGFSTVAVTGGTIYTTGLVDNQLVITAMDMDGKKLWTAQAGPDAGNVPGSRSTPVIDNGKLYLVTGVGSVLCLDAKTGRQIWSRQMSDFGGRAHAWGYAESVLVVGNMAVITPGGQNAIVALNKETGQPFWQSTGFSAPAHYCSLIYVTYQGVPMIIAGTGGGLFGVHARTGQLLWQNNFAAGNTANCSTPAFADGYVYWANGYGKGGVCVKLAVNGQQVTAQEVWRNTQIMSHHGCYVILNGCIYANSDQGSTVCLDLKTGEQKWSGRASGKGSICYADGMLYCFGENGGRAALVAATPDGFQAAGQFQVQGSGPSWAHPVVIGGRLYLRYDDNLYCFNVRG